MTAAPAAGSDPPTGPSRAHPAPRLHLGRRLHPWPRDRVGNGWRATIGGSVAVTLLRPVTWALGLAGFLAGGGILLVGLPVAVLPTPSGLQNALGGPVSTLVVGTPSAALIALIVGALIAAISAVIAGVVIGAWAEREGALEVIAAARDEGLAGGPALPPPPSVARVAMVRFLSLIPLAIAAGLAWRPLYDATYQELILPTHLATPLPLRVMRAVPLPLLMVGIVWLVSDAAAALGVRWLILERRRAIVAWLHGWLELGRRPLLTLGIAVLGIGVLIVVIGPAMLAAVTAWGHVRTMLLGATDAVDGIVMVAAWVAIWLAALVLAGLAAALRAAAWTILALPPGSSASDKVAEGGSLGVLHS